MSRAPTVPEPLRTELRTAYENQGTIGYEALYTYLTAARRAGWSLASLGEACGVTREAVRQWLLVADLNSDLEQIEVPGPPVRQTKENLRHQRMHEAEVEQQALLDKFLPRLLSLQPDAEALRGPSSSSPLKAAASAEYTRLIHEALEAGVRPSRLARALEVRVVTLYARLRRGGYKKAAPSEIRRGKIPQWSGSDLPMVG